MPDPRPAAPPRKGPLAQRPSVSGAPARTEGGPANPFAPEPQAPKPDDGRGAAGRSVRRSAEVSPSAPQAPAGDDGAPPAAPFATYGPDSRLMAGGGAGSQSRSMGVIAIVGGMVFMLASTVVIVLSVFLVWLFVFDGALPGSVAGNDEAKDKHVRDTGFANPVKPEEGAGRGRVVGDPGDRTVADPNAGPPPGPATVYVPTTMMFLSIEVNCPGGYRGRGKFRDATKGEMKATAPNVPGDEKCTVTFQGSEPAKTYVSGNQTLTCTFNPTECRAR